MRYFRRFIWYFASRLLILIIALGTMLLAFYLAMNASNIYVIMKDGLAKRAQTVMMGAPEDDLQDFFTSSCLESDAALKTARQNASPYQLYYSITGFDHRINMKYVWCWPWDVTATAVIEERIPAIDGRLNAAGHEWASALALTSTPPAWSAGRYRVTLVQQNGHWKINTLVFLEQLNE